MAWLVSILVALATAATFGAVMNDLDALGVELHRVVIGLAVVGTLVAWGGRKRWVGMLMFVVAKGAAVVAFLPQSDVAALTAAYAELRRIPGALIYFWAVPPVLLALSVVEGWALAVLDGNRSFRQTRVWRRRHAIATVLGVLSLGTGIWRLVRADYYLWRLHEAGHGPHSGSLEELGPQVLPRLYEELESLGREPAGEVRSTLVSIIQEIRYDQVATEHRAVLVTVIATSPSEVDGAMVEQLVAALENEPLDEERRRMTIWLGELDYRMAVAVFCRALPKMPDVTVSGMMGIIDGHVGHATRDVYSPTDSLYPWRGMSDAEIAERRADMRQELRRCVPEVLSARLADCHGCEPYARRRGMGMLAALGPLTDAQIAHVGRALAASDDGFTASDALEALAESVGEPRALVDAMLSDGATPAARLGALRWIATRQDGRDAEAVVCSSFGDLSSKERWVLLQASSLNPSECVTKAIRAAVDRAVDERSDPYELWVPRAIALLGRGPGVAAWATQLVEEHPDSPWRHRLHELTEP